MRVLLTDDRTQFCSTLKQLLKYDPELYLVGEASEARDLLAQAQETQPDLILLSGELLGLQANDLLFGLVTLHHHPKVVVFSEHEEACQEAAAAGCVVFDSKVNPAHWLVHTLRRVGGLSPYWVR